METKETENPHGVITEEHSKDLMEFKDAVHKYESKYRDLITGVNVMKKGNWVISFIYDFSKEEDTNK